MKPLPDEPERKEEKPEPPLDSVAIRRIIEEVRLEREQSITGYNRVYHRHNR